MCLLIILYTFNITIYCASSHPREHITNNIFHGTPQQVNASCKFCYWSMASLLFTSHIIYKTRSISDPQRSTTPSGQTEKRNRTKTRLLLFIPLLLVSYMLNFCTGTQREVNGWLCCHWLYSAGWLDGFIRRLFPVECSLYLIVVSYLFISSLFKLFMKLHKWMLYPLKCCPI